MTVGERPFAADAETDPGLLRIKGDCSMSDLETLERSLSQWRDAGPRRIDLTAAGEFDIGPAWSIHSALQEAAAQGIGVVVEGDLPRHAAYLAELAGRRPHRRRAAGRSRQRLVAGRIRARRRGARTYLARSALVRRADHRDGRARPGARCTRLRLPAFVRHAYETGVPGRAGRRGDRVPDQRDLGLYRRAAAAAHSAQRSSPSTSSRSACCANSACC